MSHPYRGLTRAESATLVTQRLIEASGLFNAGYMHCEIAAKMGVHIWIASDWIRQARRRGLVTVPRRKNGPKRGVRYSKGIPI